MQLDRYVTDLRAQLVAAADASDEARAIAERLSTALEPAARLVLLELLSEAAGQITRELAPGSVEVRLRGRDPELVVERPIAVADASRSDDGGTTDERGADAVDLDGASTSRTTLRLPDALKARAEAAAAEAGLSVNAWLVRAVVLALEPGARAAPTAPASSKGSSLTGWIR